MNQTRAVILMVTFAYLCLFGIYYVTMNLSEELLRKSITQATQSANQTVTKIFVNDVYPDITEQLDLDDRAEGLTGEALDIVDHKVRSFMFGTDVLKVKVFNLAGLTVYSTEHAQINQSREDNSAFQTAAQGGLGSQITHKGKFSAIDQMVFDRDLVSSYIPIRDKKRRILGVLEVYTDRTAELAKVAGFLNQLKSTLIIALSITGLGISLLMWVSLYRKVDKSTDE
ncbi:hypothetical protein [Terasakiella sp. SH-1]|uniref:hypothetical protein n=1 Tax=Terasakiella sp. SH-1 TaxID=2560057 RepID=UPI0010744CFF|nr:hypothetical protein [Terasakiella sp. SH-1]